MFIIYYSLSLSLLKINHIPWNKAKVDIKDSSLRVNYVCNVDVIT